MKIAHVIKPLSSTIMAGILFLLMGMIVQGGSTLDYGSVTGNPPDGNYLAWVSSSAPPSQVLTEDGYNPGTGVNQGFVLGAWILNAGNFASPTAVHDGDINMLFGGLGTNTGTIWTYTFKWDGITGLTNHGTKGVSASGTCPAMTQGSQGAGGKVINWSSTGAAGYAIYRSVNPSGAGNGASNGRYDLVTTVSSGTNTYTDAACPTGTDCWHVVVPLNASNQISGCHSQETNPTAVTLRFFRSDGAAVNWPLLAGGAALAALLAGAGVYRWRVRRAETR